MSDTRTLLNRRIRTSYRRFLQVPENGVDDVVRDVCDGEGDVLPLRMSKTVVEVPVAPTTLNSVANKLYVDGRTQTVLRITDYGAVADGVTNCATALVNAMTAAAAVGGRVLFPAATLAYAINTVVTIPSNIELVFEDGAQIVTTTSVLFRIAGSNVKLVDPWIRGPHSTNVYMIDIEATANDCQILNILMENGNSGIKIEGPRARVTGRFHELRGTAVRVSADLATSVIPYDCEIDIFVRNAVGFGVFVTDAPLARARVSVSHIAVPELFTAWQIANRPEAVDGQMGIEGVGVTVNSPEGAFVHRCYRQGSGDAGLTFSSDRNSLDYMTAINCAATGCSILGSGNIIGVVKADACKRGVSFTPNAGGFAQNNMVTSAYVTNNEEQGVYNSANIYRTWVSGATYSGTASFCIFGLNCYRCSPAVDTFGTIAPTHTSGTVSDGLVDWTYVSTAVGTVDASGNYVGQIMGSGNPDGNVVNDADGTLVVGFVEGNGLSSWGGNVPNNAHVPSGDARGVGAVDWQTSRIFGSQVASGATATIIGGRQNRAAGTDAIAGGLECDSPSTAALALGAGNIANASYSRAFGRFAHAQARYGIRVEASGRFGTRDGSAQRFSSVLRGASTDATPIRLTTDATAADNSNTSRIMPNGTQAGKLEVIARDKATDDYAFWTLDVSGSRGALAASTAIVGGGASLSPTQSRGGASAYRLAVTADTTNGAVAITGTGVVATSIEWIATYTGVEQSA